MKHVLPILGDSGGSEAGSLKIAASSPIEHDDVHDHDHQEDAIYSSAELESGDLNFAGDEGHTYWQSLEQQAADPEFIAKVEREFPQGASELEMSGTSRRQFLGVFGASMALAGVTLSGCVRKPKEKILPLTQRPENLIPGKPRHYATSLLSGGSVLGVVVESFDGRPTKIEGNPEHPNSLGAASAWAQASVLDVYDPHRSQKPKKGPAELPWTAAHDALKVAGSSGGLAILTERRPSPTLHALLAELAQKRPGTQIFEHDAASTGNTEAGLALAGIGDLRALYHFDQAEIVAAFDCDFLATEGDSVRNARLWSQKRKTTSQNDSLSRHYQIEPTYTVSGAAADNRLRTPGTQVGEVLADVAASLLAGGASIPSGAEGVAQAVLGRKRSAHAKWAGALAKDLLAKRGKSIVLVGDRQAPHVHALGWFVNELLGNDNATITFAPAADVKAAGRLDKLVAAIKAKSVKTLVVLGCNPVYDSPAFAAVIKDVETVIHLSSHFDETSRKATWHLPRSHYLEAWGDLRATDGTVSIVQPLIAPLHDTISEIEVMGRILGKAQPAGYALVRAHWVAAGFVAGATANRDWNRTLHDGLNKGSAPPAARASLSFGGAVAGWAAAPQALPAPERLELVMQLDSRLYDGRYGTNPWMQEVPDQVTKITWDNAVLVSPSTAGRLRLKSNDKVVVSLGDKKVKAAVNVTPGVAESSIVLNIGYGRHQSGPVARGAGFNVFRLGQIGAPGFAQGVTVKKLPGSYKLATTQMHHTMVEPLTGRKRPIIREASLKQYKADPDWVQKLEIMPPAKVKTHLWTPPNETTGHQWGMVIDLSTCIGCNACSIACQAENNIPVVGKARVIQGREMHWIRLDRYFDGKDQDDPLMVFQPMACQHCETAPCEGVCPVAATTHSPEGLNDMAYNRCIGTRYCSNNCPFKVRRFNFFNFSLENDEKYPLLSMQRNPDVTVRFRGVMEKCTYCVQRINQAKIVAKRDGDGVVKDGEIVPACQQTCPTGAITFGDTNDPQSAVSKLKKQNKNYEVLGDLNVKARTTYLAKVRNPNPEIS